MSNVLLKLNSDYILKWFFNISSYKNTADVILELTLGLTLLGNQQVEGCIQCYTWQVKQCSLQAFL